MRGGSLCGCLTAVVGQPHVYSTRDDISRYNEDGRGSDGNAALVVRPGSVAEVSALMRLAADLSFVVIPQGARTGLVGAGIASSEKSHIILSLERISGIRDMDVVNRSLTAGGGSLLSAVNAAAGQHDLFFPIDVGSDPTVGGMVGANIGGARFMRYGDVRRNLMAIEVVLADGHGTVIRLGQPLWKDNSGLDLKQLWVGGAGSMGVVTEATLALQPKPVNRVTALISLKDPETAIPLLSLLEDAFGTLLTAFEGMSRSALTATLSHIPGARSPFAQGLPGYAVLVEVASGHAIGVSHIEEALTDVLMPLFDRPDAAIADIVIDRRDDLWAIRHSIPEGLRARGRVIGCDVSLRRGDIMRFRREIADSVGALAPQLELCDFGHIGDGGLHCNFVWDAHAEPFDPLIAEAARSLVFQTVVDHYQGSFSAEHGIGPVNAHYYETLISTGERKMAGSIQRLLAPQPIGRVNFGLGV